MSNTKKIRKLLTLEDLEQFYSSKKRSFHFSANNDSESVVVQVPGTLSFAEDDYDPTLGLLPVHLASCHIGVNRNKSSISEEKMNQAIPSVYNRPILGFIQQLKDGSYDFAGHEMFVNDDGEMEYEEIAVGTIPESCNAKLVYDEDNDKTYLELDGYVYEEYTRAADILREKKQSKVSVELSLLEFSYDAKSKHLSIDKFYFSGITILGVTRDGSETPIEEGMYGSNIKLKDFSKSNNSMFTNVDDEEHSKLIEMLEKLNEKIDSLSSFAIEGIAQPKLEEGGNDPVNKFEELLSKYNKTVEDITFEYENLSDDDLEAKFAEVFEDDANGEGVDPEPASDGEGATPEGDDSVVNNSVEEDGDTGVDDGDDSVAVNNNADAAEGSEGEGTDKGDSGNDDGVQFENKFTKTFELSHDDIRGALYTLLQPYEESDNDWYWIMEVFDNRFVYQGLMGNLFGQNYTVDGGNVAFDGERYELFIEYLTASEKAELETMRSNYSSISEELNSYKEAEMFADKMTVFEDESYANYLETEEFKTLMEKENVMKFTKEELTEKADAALGRLVKVNKTFSLKDENKEEKKPSFFAFSKVENNTSFLDGLLKKTN